MMLLPTAGVPTSVVRFPFLAALGLLSNEGFAALLFILKLVKQFVDLFPA